MREWIRRNRAGIIGALVIALILAVVYIVTSASQVHAATSWAYVWGWSPSRCGTYLNGTATWAWDTVMQRPNWLCRYPR
jgi:hypothetical protein